MQCIKEYRPSTTVQYEHHTLQCNMKMEGKEVKDITTYGEDGGFFSSFLCKLSLTRLVGEKGENFYRR